MLGRKQRTDYPDWCHGYYHSACRDVGYVCDQNQSQVVYWIFIKQFIVIFIFVESISFAFFVKYHHHRSARSLCCFDVAFKAVNADWGSITTLPATTTATRFGDSVAHVTFRLKQTAESRPNWPSRRKAINKISMGILMQNRLSGIKRMRLITAYLVYPTSTRTTSFNHPPSDYHSE